MGCRPGIAFHGLFPGDADSSRWIARQISAQPNFPLRVEMGRAFRPHPGRESFVKPQIVPPGHGHEITEPLVRHFVREHFVDILFRLSRGVSRIKQKRGLVISNAAPVFHRTAETAGKSDLIKLRQRIRHTEIIVVIL